MSGHQQLGPKFRQRLHRRADDRLEQPTGQMEPADDRVDLVNPGQLSCISSDVDHPRVTAAREDHQPLPTNVHHQRLLIQDQRVWSPLPLPQRLVNREPLLERRRPLHLPGDQYRSIDEEARLPRLHDLEPSALQR